MDIILNLTGEVVRIRRNPSAVEASPHPDDLVLGAMLDYESKPHRPNLAEKLGSTVQGPNDILCYRPVSYELGQMPAEVEGVIYLIPRPPQGVLVADRRDLYFIGNHPEDNPIRDANGDVFAVTCLIKPC